MQSCYRFKSYPLDNPLGYNSCKLVDFGSFQNVQGGCLGYSVGYFLQFLLSLHILRKIAKKSSILRHTVLDAFVSEENSLIFLLNFANALLGARTSVAFSRLSSSSEILIAILSNPR